jgi:hypothetical protein
MAITTETGAIEANICTWNREVDSDYLQSFIARKLGNVALASEDLE